MHIMKAAIYLRQSSDPRNDHLGVDRQRTDCVALCEAKSWGWAEYMDNDTSATSRKPRPAYERMLTDIRNGAIGAVVVWDLDRLYRKPRELEDLIDLAEVGQVALATVTGDVDLGTDNGRTYARIKAAIARGETERKVARMKRRYEQDAQRGVSHNGAARAFGYAPDETLDPVRSGAVRKAYAGILVGRSLYGIADEWNAQGFTSARGKAWTQTGVRAVLLNPRNAGLRAHNGEIVGPAVWPAIVDRDTFDAVTAILTSPNRRVGGARGRKYLLSGLAVCGKCEKRLGSAMPSKRGQEPRYHCKHCHGVARKIASVDKFVLDVVAERLSREDALDLVTKRDVPDLAALRARATALRTSKDEMAVAKAKGQVTLSQLIAHNEETDRQLAEIKDQTEDDGKARILKDVILVGDRAAVLAKILGYDLDRQRAIIDVLLTVTVLPGQARGELRTKLLPITWKD
jgi:DNA invertase Pin-like site-specific DNA recombinase